MYKLKDLKVWSDTEKLVHEVLHVIEGLPNKDEYWITSEIKRSVLSIPSSIAGGSEASGNFCYFLNVALVSAHELQMFIRLSYNLELVGKTKRNILRASIMEIQKMIEDLIKSSKKD